MRQAPFFRQSGTSLLMVLFLLSCSWFTLECLQEEDKQTFWRISGEMRHMSRKQAPVVYQQTNIFFYSPDFFHNEMKVAKALCDFQEHVTVVKYCSQLLWYIAMIALLSVIILR